MTEPFSREIALKIFEEIKGAKNILMHCHPSPDADSMGSVLAMKFALESIGKKATVIAGDSKKPVYIKSLPGYDTVIEQNYFETKLDDFDLFLILDTAALSQISRKGEVVFPEYLKTIVIDHHKTNPGYAAINLVDASYSSTCHIVYDLLNVWNINLTKEIALNVFAGMYSDTGGFKYRGTTTKTLEVASKLAAIAPNFTELLFSMENSNTKGRLILEGHMLANLETWFNDSVAIATVSNEWMKSHGITEDEASGIDIANMLKSVINWNIGITLMEKEPGHFRLSFRSRDGEKYDVSKVAAVLGGGGHKGAAGASVDDSMERAKNKVKGAISEALGLAE